MSGRLPRVAGSGGDPEQRMGSRATELRRRIENRRQGAAFATRGDDEDEERPMNDVVETTLVDSGGDGRRRARGALLRTKLDRSGALRAVLDAKRGLYEIQSEVFEADAQTVASIRCADQQFTIEKSMRGLGSDINAVLSTVRLKTDRLSDLHTRVRHLSRMVNESSPEKVFAKNKIMTREEIRGEKILTRKCPRCRRSFLPALIDDHQSRCDGMRAISETGLEFLEQRSNQNGEKSAHLSILDNDTRMFSRFISQPPRNLRIEGRGATHNSLTVHWDPPIFTGSYPIIDFMLEFSIVHRQRSKSGEYRREDIPTQPVRTSHWCLMRPVPPNEYRLTHLTADQEYGSIRLSAITKTGKSSPSNTIDLVKTSSPVAPSAPLFLTVGVVTAKTITLTWTEPMDDGGKEIVDYEIDFIEAIMEESTTLDKNYLDVSNVVYKERLVRTYSADPSFMIDNLLSGKEHKNFRVRAVNASGIPGEFSNSIASVFTIAPGNEFKLLDELQAAVNARTRIVDSQFLSGFMQRYERSNYIDLVSKFIISTHPELEPRVSAILERSNIPEASEDKTDNEIEHSKPQRRQFDELSEPEMITERRRQFHFRIEALKGEVRRVEYNVQWCKDRRVDLVALIRGAECRIIEKQAELERARMFRGPQMDSDVLENGLQRFYTKDLIVGLEDEIEIEQLYIVDTKAEIVKTENHLRADMKRLSTVHDRLRDREEALARFELDPIAAVRENHDTKRLSFMRLRDRLLYRTFAALVENRDTVCEARRKLRTALKLASTWKLRVSIKHWREIARISALQNFSYEGVVGKGSTSLLTASIGRGELAFEARNMLEQLRQIDAKLQSLSWSSKKRVDDAVLIHTKGKKFYPFWLEAEAKLRVNDFEGAYRLFQLIEQHESWVKSMSAQQHFLLEKAMGYTLYSLGRYDEALIRFNRSLILATTPTSCNKLDEAAACLSLANVYLSTASIRQSIEFYERSLLCFEASGDRRGQLECYRGLERSFMKLEDREAAAHNKTLADEMEYDLENKLQAASNKLNELQHQLVGIGAESSFEVVLERVKAAVPRLRRQRIACQYRIREEAKWVANLEGLLAEKKSLLSQGESDLKRALASDSTQVDSNIITGTDARYEIEDYKRKLAKLMGVVKAAEDHITKEIVNSQVRSRNAEDELKELEAELHVETGALMRRMLLQEPMRCFAFNSTNEALKNVIGTASHGISTCCASAGRNGFLFDILTGACLSQAVGDLQKEHLGDPIGHRAPIVSLFCIGDHIYTGSMDATVGVWNVNEESIGGYACKLTKLLVDFDSAVVSIHADSQWLACGCSDCDVFLFDSASLTLMARVIAAHDRSTTAIIVESFNSTFTTGGADGQIKVWEVQPASTVSTSAKKKTKLVHTLQPERRGDVFFNGHLHPVSCVRQVASEIVSSDTGGRIIIWNLEAIGRKLLRICDVHKTAVVCLQFDATKIVSGGSDGIICVTDFATGHLIQTLVGHEAGILDLQFDRKRLISMSADGRLRLWYWQTRIGVGADRKKYHILGAGETLKALSLKYRTSIDKLLQWNNLPDSSKLYMGQKLVVDIDTDGAASDELQTLDTRVSTQFGKLAYDDLDFLAANKVKTQDVEAQWAAQRLAQLAKEYFPPLTDNEEGHNDDSRSEKEDSDEDSLMAVDEDEAGDSEASSHDKHENDDVG